MVVRVSSVRPTALSLFSGCGGMDLGAQQAGFDVVQAYDLDADSVASYNANLPSRAVEADVAEIVNRHLPRADLVLGGPPCQGFSTAGAKRQEDPRNGLWQAYVDILEAIRPAAFLLENVLGFQTQEIPFRNALHQATNGSYSVEFRKLNAQLFGVPQHRYRLFAVGVRNEFSHCQRWPQPIIADEWGYKKRLPGLVSIRQALEDLGPPGLVPRHGQVGLDGNAHVCIPLEPNHAAIGVHIPNGGSLKDIPDARLPAPYAGRQRTGDPGWFWYYRKPDHDLPGRTVMATMTPTFATALAPDVFHESKAGAWSWRPVQPDDYRSGDGLYTSPVPVRRLSIRECARLQTFPDSYSWVGTAQSQHRQIGNAVPCELARALCTVLRDLIQGRGVRVTEPTQETFSFGFNK